MDTIEAGKHDIALTYHVPTLKTGLMLSAAAIVAYLLLLAMSFWWKKREKTNDSMETEA